MKDIWKLLVLSLPSFCKSKVTDISEQVLTCPILSTHGLSHGFAQSPLAPAPHLPGCVPCDDGDCSVFFERGALLGTGDKVRANNAQVLLSRSV